VCDVELKNYLLYSKVDWENLHTVEPPFIPNPDDDSDTSYFNGRHWLVTRITNFLNASMVFLL